MRTRMRTGWAFAPIEEDISNPGEARRRRRRGEDLVVRFAMRIAAVVEMVGLSSYGTISGPRSRVWAVPVPVMERKVGQEEEEAVMS